MVLHVRYNSLYISLPSSAKQQRVMTKFCVVWRTWATTANFSKFYFKFIAVSQIQFRDSLDSDDKLPFTKVALSAAAICARNEAALCDFFPYG